ncbi:unnamed protein product [Oncorhynchus mykiss]|uniref:Uncharacterized protein n=1 Tax=Oncorhynchus mykiss TaxID=8022 RepID=A0A060YWU6_ONCMY|nr:unnamed protein product [Oncorhynchus mykiss]
MPKLCCSFHFLLILNRINTFFSHHLMCVLSDEDLGGLLSVFSTVIFSGNIVCCVPGNDEDLGGLLSVFSTVILFSGNIVCCVPGNDEDLGGLLSANLILLRNRLLDILLKLLFTTKEKCTVNTQACEELVRTLGFDWLLMFTEEHLHSSSVTAALWILVVLLSNQPILTRFKEGLTGGEWLDHTDSVLTNKIGTVMGE